MGDLSSKIDSHAQFVIRLAEEALRLEADAQVDTVDDVDAVDAALIDLNHPILWKDMTSVSDITVSREQGRGCGLDSRGWGLVSRVCG